METHIHLYEKVALYTDYVDNLTPPHVILFKDKDLVKYSNSSSQDSDTSSFDPNNIPYIDLGLSVYWYINGCTGGKYRWGETEVVDPSTPYKFGKYPKYTKYNDYEDHKNVLDLEDDAAHKEFGGTWRMPTAKEVYELISNCKFVANTYGDIDGDYDGFYFVSNINRNELHFKGTSYYQDDKWTYTNNFLTANRREGEDWTVETFYIWDTSLSPSQSFKDRVLDAWEASDRETPLYALAVLDKEK